MPASKKLLDSAVPTPVPRSTTESMATGQTAPCTSSNCETAPTHSPMTANATVSSFTISNLPGSRSGRRTRQEHDALRQLGRCMRLWRRPGRRIVAVSTPGGDPLPEPSTQPQSRHLATLLLYIAGESIPSIGHLDSCSCASLISDSLFNSLSVKGELSGAPFGLRTASGNPLDVRGCSNISLRIGGQTFRTRMFVVKGLALPLLLGYDFMVHNGFVLNFKTSQLAIGKDDGSVEYLCQILGGRSMRIRETKRENQATAHHIAAVGAGDVDPGFSAIVPEACSTGPPSVHPARAVKIRPHTVTFVPIKILSSDLESDYVFVPNRHIMKERQVAMSNSAIGPKTVMIPICNETNRKRVLFPSDQLGKLLPLHKADEAELVCSALAEKEGEESQRLERLKFNVNPNMDPAERQQLLALLHEFRDCFTDSLRGMRIARVPEVEIALKENKIVRTRPYRLSKAEREALRERLDVFLEVGIVEPSTSPYCSSVCFVKKNGKFRMIQDLRKVNKLLAKVSWPIPRVDDVIDRFAGAKYLASIDLKVAFQQIPLAPGLSRDIFSFETEFGNYRWATLPQGMKNSPFYLALAMYKVYAPLLHPGSSQLEPGKKLSQHAADFSMYFDDCNFHSKTFSDFYSTIKEFLQLSRAARVTLSAEKSVFGYPEIKVLGFMVSGTSVRMPDDAVEAIKKFKTPEDRTELQSLLGSLNFFRRFVPDYSKKTTPLYALLKRDARFLMGPEELTALEQVRNELAANVPISLFDDSCETALFCDGSRSGLGAVLGQKVGGKWLPCYCASRTLHGSEKRYSPTELELLACCFGVKTFRHHLLGREFKIFSDHKALSHIDSLTTSNARLAKFMLYLSPFEYSISYLPGKEQVWADALSRLSTVPAPEESLEDEIDASILAVTRSASRQSADAAQNTASGLQADASGAAAHLDEPLPVPALGLQTSLEPSWRIPEGQSASEFTGNSQRADPLLAPIITSLEKDDAMCRQARHYRLSDGVLHTKGGLVVVPASLQTAVLATYHNAGHFAAEKTLQSIRQRYDWEGIRRAVSDYCARCHTCQLKKVTRPRNPGELQPLVANDCFELVIADFLGPLPASNFYHYVLIFVCSFTKFVVAYPTRDNSAASAVRCFVKLVQEKGCPARFYSDAVPFASAEFSDHLSQACVEQFVAPPDTHFCVGAAESAVKRIKTQLRIMLDEVGPSWSRALPVATMFINSSVMPAIKCSPFFALHGYVPRVALDNVLGPVRNTTLEGRLRRLAADRESLRVILLNYRTSMKRYYDARQHRVVFEPGDKVKVFKPGSPIGMKKDAFSGPHEVLSKLNEQTYLIRMPVRGTLQDKPIHAWNLERYLDPKPTE